MRNAIYFQTISLALIARALVIKKIKNIDNTRKNVRNFIHLIHLLRPPGVLEEALKTSHAALSSYSRHILSSSIIALSCVTAIRGEFDRSSRLVIRSRDRSRDWKSTCDNERKTDSKSHGAFFDATIILFSPEETKEKKEMHLTTQRDERCSKKDLGGLRSSSRSFTD